MSRKVRDPAAPARIVEAAWRVVAENGIKAATVRAIADEAGVSTGFITHYFADKRELIADVLRYNNARALRRVSAATRNRHGLAAVEAALVAVLPVDVDRRREWQVWVSSWGQTSVGEELANGLSGGWRGLRSLITELLRQAADAGELAADLALDYEAERLITLVAGAGLLAGVEAPTRVRREARQMLADHLAQLRSTNGRPAWARTS